MGTVPKSTVDNNYSVRQTEMNRMYVARLKNDLARYADDVDQEKRTQFHECRVCFYLRASRMGGNAITRWFCGVCEAESSHGSTAVPKVCLACATKNELCTHCGGDVELIVRKKEVKS